jgi:hypothetical protein
MSYIPRTGKQYQARTGRSRRDLESPTTNPNNISSRLIAARVFTVNQSRSLLFFTPNQYLLLLTGPIPPLPLLKQLVVEACENDLPDSDIQGEE